MKEIRDIKIDLLMDNKNPIVDLFREITKDLQIINCDVYNKEGLEFIYHKDGQWIFYQDAKNGEFWCVYNRYWKIFESEFNFKYEEIAAITKFLVEDALKREVDTPGIRIFKSGFRVEDALKREVDTPKCIYKIREGLVEDALKRNRYYKSTILHNSRKVEDALKRRLNKKGRLSTTF